MISAGKFIVGLLTTLLLAVAAHNGLHLGSRFIDQLESRAITAVGQAGGIGVRLSFVRNPSLQRVAILSGDTDAATRARLLAEVRALPGVHDARWMTADRATALWLETALLLAALYCLGVALGAMLWRRNSSGT